MKNILDSERSEEWQTYLMEGDSSLRIGMTRCFV
jgi:hypothetical protein